MSILIRGMEMPTSCDKCRFCVNGFTDDAPMYECAVQSEDIVSVLVESDGKPFDFRPDWCPLVDIPTPHGRLIDADRLDCLSWCDTGGCFEDGVLWVVNKIDELPTIIEAEGSEE